MHGVNTTLELPYIYYLGYEVKLINNGETEIVDYTESDKGFIQVELTDEVSNIEIQVKYTGTTLMKVSYMLTLVGVICLIIYIYKEKLENLKYS